MARTSRNVAQWAGLKIARRAAKSVPFVGTLISIGFLGYAIRKKGLAAGIADTALDAIPFVGAVKNGIELLTDDLFPDLPERRSESGAPLEPGGLRPPQTPPRGGGGRGGTPRSPA
ncbi:MAG TPA: hypothetical protein VFM29_04535 [Vicinamibacteria bacterium]|nr:hypothetical protein [Vicinamibacteria bacterium]